MQVIVRRGTGIERANGTPTWLAWVHLILTTAVGELRNRNTEQGIAQGGNNIPSFVNAFITQINV